MRFRPHHVSSAPPSSAPAVRLSVRAGQNHFLDHPNMSRAGLSTFNRAARLGDDATPLERFEALMGSPAYSLLVVRVEERLRKEARLSHFASSWKPRWLSPSCVSFRVMLQWGP